jgi:hypothetical protein
MHELFDSTRMLCATLEAGGRIALWRALCAAVDPCMDQFSRGLLASRGGLPAGSGIPSQRHKIVLGNNTAGQARVHSQPISADQSARLPRFCSAAAKASLRGVGKPSIRCLGLGRRS